MPVSEKESVKFPTCNGWPLIRNCTMNINSCGYDYALLSHNLSSQFMHFFPPFFGQKSRLPYFPFRMYVCRQPKWDHPSKPNNTSAWYCNRLNCMVLHSISWYHMVFHCIPFLLAKNFDIYNFWELLKSRSLLSIRSISIYRGRQKNFQEREVFMYFSLIPTNSNVQPWMKIKQNICLLKFSSRIVELY